ncbi:hypothetical protein [Thalassomonas haliotis]|uniref:Uncharacterized protein n=1 Tax=Thalassomonas haliotis TaxID=485448 RepID=A0ABY7VDU8_9GAMM|nr:hypothetical protein [Thalassomonas haliotis]WDE11155.1 hypothetical protein H3N35_23435 [Thalassomonas haliotis]
MSLTQDIANVVQAAENMTATVTGKIAEIDNKVIQAKDSFDSWRASVQAEDINGARLYKSEIDLTGLSTDYFYPVWWIMPGNSRGETQMTIARNYSADSHLQPFGAGIVHIAGLNLQLEGAAYSWNGDANYLTVKRISQTYRKTVRNIAFAMPTIARPINSELPLYNGHSDGEIVPCRTRSGCYLRGGLKYQVIKNFNDDLWYSREDEEVTVSSSVNTSWGIKWMAKSYHIDDAALGGDYGETRLAYMLDYDQRYALKG